MPAMALPGGRGRGGYRPPGMAYTPPGFGPPPAAAAAAAGQGPTPPYGSPQYHAWLRQQQSAASAAAAQRAQHSAHSTAQLSPQGPPGGAASSVKWEAPVMPQSYAQSDSGLSASASASSLGGVGGGEEDDDENECIICMSADRNALCMPCGHRNMCSACAEEYLLAKHNHCPVCRTKLVALYLMDQNKTLPLPTGA